MKRVILFLIIFLSFAHSRVEINFITLKMDYREYVNNKIIDSDRSNYGDLYGMRLSFSKDYFLIGGEFVKGSSVYDGALSNGIPVVNRQKNVYIWDVYSFFYLNSFIGFNIGYRFWNRGESGKSYDYNEQYYWQYVGLTFKKDIVCKRWEISPFINFNMAINPELKVYLGNNPVLRLGFTRGYIVEIPFKYRVSNNIMLSFFYKIKYWHINKSKTQTLILNNTSYTIYEPESKTQNQYLGVGVEYNF